MSEIKFINGRELLEKGLSEMPALIEPILPKVGLAAVTGSSDTGKSSFLRHLALAIVLGDEEFLGFRINSTHQSVVYVATEDDEDAT
ncbi:MAG TPA: AAA family ATPase, partial [Prolixibacteraceae bacterium]|nr:AAA family ATPase [Prolixibacteraceae bacterium]